MTTPPDLRRRSTDEPFQHGYGAYSGGRCRCAEVCRPAASAYRREQRLRRLEWLTAHPDDPSHGLRASYDCGCRCEPCREARFVAGVLRGEFTGRGRDVA